MVHNARVVAIDYAPAMLSVADQRLRNLGVSAEFVQADAYAIPFGRVTFDSAFFGCWMSHVPYTRVNEFLDELQRVLKTGAVVMAIDTAPPPGGGGGLAPGAEYFNPRVLNDRSRHRVLKIDHSPETLGSTLAALGRVIESWTTGHFFVGAMIEVP